MKTDADDGKDDTGRFWTRDTEHRTYRELLYDMAAGVHDGLKTDGLGAVWCQAASLVGFHDAGRYVMLAFTDIKRVFTASGQSVDEAYGALVYQMSQCKDLDKELA